MSVWLIKFQQADDVKRISMTISRLIRYVKEIFEDNILKWVYQD